MFAATQATAADAREFGAVLAGHRDQPVLYRFAKGHPLGVLEDTGLISREQDMFRGHPSAKASDRTRLALFSGAGFSDELRSLAARAADIELVGLERLYEGY